MGGRRLLGVAALLGGSTFSRTATADENVPEGFFVQLGAGAGFSRYYEKAKAPRSKETKIRSRSLSSSLDLSLGGAVVPGLVVGVGVLGRSMLDPSIEVNRVLYESTSSTLGMSALNVFGQWHPGWIATNHGQLYLRVLAGYAESAVQFQHVALAGEPQSGPLLGGALGYSFAEITGFCFSAEASMVGAWLTARHARVHSDTSWYSGTYGLAVSYY
jgi:hypothetical protein